MIDTASGRFCHYCGAPGATVAWPTNEGRLTVWACADRNACTRRARVLAAARLATTGGAA